MNERGELQSSPVSCMEQTALLLALTPASADAKRHTNGDMETRTRIGRRGSNLYFRLYRNGRCYSLSLKDAPISQSTDSSERLKHPKLPPRRSLCVNANHLRALST